MRIWGRLPSPISGQPPIWVEVTTDANGMNDGVRLTNLAQCLLLNLGEDPFFSTFGINAQQSVATQIFPDFYTYQTQAAFQQYFALLTIRKRTLPTPTYDINAITHSGAIIQESIPT
jgi:hypothetical protein